MEMIELRRPHDSRLEHVRSYGVPYCFIALLIFAGMLIILYNCTCVVHPVLNNIVNSSLWLCSSWFVCVLP